MYRDERPYEKCEQYGAAHLTDAELLAVLLRTGTKGENSLSLARKLLHPDFGEGGILSIHRWTKESLLRVKGIGKVKAIQILCLSELSRRLAKASAASKLNFSAPDTIAQYYMEDMRHQKKEVLKLLLLNARTGLIGEVNISTGTVDTALISPRELFIEALLRGAVSIVLLHNHPSGDPTPSKEDVRITRRIQSAGSMIGIELLDHIIIGNNCFISLREKGFLRRRQE